MANLEEQVLDVLKTTYDPEIPANIVDLGLIYDVVVDEDSNVLVSMTLTTPSCPAAGVMPSEIQRRLGALKGVNGAKVEVVWDPPWSPERMSEATRLALGLL